MKLISHIRLNQASSTEHEAQMHLNLDLLLMCLCIKKEPRAFLYVGECQKMIKFTNLVMVG